MYILWPKTEKIPQFPHLTKAWSRVFTGFCRDFVRWSSTTLEMSFATWAARGYQQLSPSCPNHGALLGALLVFLLELLIAVLALLFRSLLSESLSAGTSMPPHPQNWTNFVHSNIYTYCRTQPGPPSFSWTSAFCTPGKQRRPTCCSGSSVLKISEFSVCCLLLASSVESGSPRPKA